MRSASLLALLLCACACVALVAGAGHTTHAKRTPIPREWNHPKRFPSHHDIAHDPHLHAKFGGDNKLHIHVTAHTHDDVGWLKTVDQYYLGANNSIQHAAVRHILDTVVEELSKNAARKFVYVEQAFFQMWYARQSAAKQAEVAGLVASGQLEFLNGGWCMHDEAATHYIDMIDQTTLGHQYLLKQFGVTPKIGWQIDPFGHSATQAALLSAEVGFEGLFFGRIDHQDRDVRMAAQNMEFIWRASPSLGPSAQVFTGVFQDGNYGPPNGFCFDWFCDDAPMITDDAFIDYNVPSRVDEFLTRINYQAAFTKGKNLMIQMGSDFQYENAREWFENLDALIEAVNADGRVTMQYSTPSLYVAAKNAENITWSVKSDDFFPYADDDHSYWTGYFTSRPALKRYVRTSSALLQTARQVELLAGGDGSATMPLSKAVGVAQHHDAVSGTSKQHVAFDYAQRLHIAQTAAQQMMADALAQMTIEGHAGSSAPVFSFCELANITVCDVSAQLSPSAFQVLLYNPSARARTETVRVPIANILVDVLDHAGRAVPAQIVRVLNVTSHVADSAQEEVLFQATVPPLGFASYFVTQAQEHTEARVGARHRHHKHGKTVRSESVEADPAAGDVSISNGALVLTFSGATGMASSLQDLVGNVTLPFQVTFGYYASYAGDGQKSGAYIFRPAAQSLKPIVVEGVPQLLVQTGPVTQQVTQVLNAWLNITYRLNAGAPCVEVEYTVGAIPIDDNVGKEVVIQYATNIDSDATWFSDSNAREMIKRVRNYRQTWNLTVTEPIAGNYVPINAAAYLTDGSTQLTVLTDRSQGVVSMQDGTLELMVHRRTLQDDARGVGEPINETALISPYPDFARSGPALVITGTHYVFLGNASRAAALWRPFAQRVYAPLTQAYAPLDGAVADYVATHVTQATNLGKGSELPLNVDLVSLQSWAPWSSEPADPAHPVVLLRLAHMFGAGEDPLWARPAQVDLNTLFAVPPVSIAHMSLTANRPAKELQQENRMQWGTEGENAEANMDAPEPVPLRDTIATLNPMQVQTFILQF